MLAGVEYPHTCKVLLAGYVARARADPDKPGAVAGHAATAATSFETLQPGKGVVENKHSTDVESPPRPPRVCVSIQPEGKSCSNLG